jgi:transposase
VAWQIFRIFGLSKFARNCAEGRAYDAVLMFKVLVLQTLYTVSDDQTEYQLKDRLSFMRFVGLVLHDAVPDAKTIWLYREQLARAGAAERLFARFDALLKAKGWLAMGGQIIGATVIEARRRNGATRRRATQNWRSRLSHRLSTRKQLRRPDVHASNHRKTQLFEASDWSGNKRATSREGENQSGRMSDPPWR